MGIGGRLDSTNVINSALSIITAVQMDHAHILGNTVEAITTEKCGIFKRRSDAIIAPGVPLNIAAVCIHNEIVFLSILKFSNHLIIYFI